MDIPSLDPQGLLPPGIHECSLAQIISTFGRTGVEHRRTFLCGRLEEFLPWVRSVNCFRSLFIDGSFVTDKEEPNDIGPERFQSVPELPNLTPDQFWRD